MGGCPPFVFCDGERSVEEAEEPEGDAVAGAYLDVADYEVACWVVFYLFEGFVSAAHLEEGAVGCDEVALAACFQG